MNFTEAETYLFSLGNEVETMKLGLENISTLLAALSEPHTKYKKVQVAGTNGKGSVCAFLNSICVEAGIRTGLFTSPHLISIRERIQIDGNNVSEKRFAHLASTVREVSEKLLADGSLTYRPTFFEQITAIALLAFAEAGVELAILETGLGGRFDATTAAKAEIAAITRIDLDHQEYLGDTIEKIAAEKAAIIHEGSSVVIGKQAEPSLRILLDRCAEVGVTPNFEIYEPWSVTPTGSDTYRVDTTRYSYSDVLLGLKGRHQAENAQTALNIGQSLEYEFGFVFEDSGAVPAGLENARHPGRLEYIGNVLLDGAHNPSGAKALAVFLDEFEPEPVTLIFGAMKDKAVAEILEILVPYAKNVVFTRASNSRSMEASELSRNVPHEHQIKEIRGTDSVAAALSLAREKAGGGVIIVTGSLYLVGEVRKLLLTETGR